MRSSRRTERELVTGTELCLSLNAARHQLYSGRMAEPIHCVKIGRAVRFWVSDVAEAPSG